MSIYTYPPWKDCLKSMSFRPWGTMLDKGRKKELLKNHVPGPEKEPAKMFLADQKALVRPKSQNWKAIDVLGAGMKVNLRACVKK